MRFSSLKLGFFGLVGLAASAPTSKRGFYMSKPSQSPPPSNFGVGSYGSFNQFSLSQVNDVDILQFALMLEIEQTLFYQQAFTQFSVTEMLSVGLSETEIIEFQNALLIEQTHVNTIVNVLQSLGQQPLNQPEFFFNFESPVDFVEQLSVQESIAVGAYLGAAPLISSSTILSSAASIMSIESRQASFTNAVLGINSFSSAFETSLSIEQVVQLVAPLIASIPDNTILQTLGFSASSFTLEQLSVSAFTQVSIDSNFFCSFHGGSEISPPPSVSQLYCAWSVGSDTFYTSFTPGHGCDVSQSLEVGNVVTVQITVAESISLSQCLSAPQFVTII